MMQDIKRLRQQAHDGDAVSAQEVVRYAKRHGLVGLASWVVQLAGERMNGCVPFSELETEWMIVWMNAVNVNSYLNGLSYEACDIPLP